MKVLSFLFVTLAAVARAKDSYLRGDHDLTLLLNEDLDVGERELFVCNVIEHFFDGAVDCTCKMNVLFGTAGFKCTYVNDVCIRDVCFKPNYGGMFSIGYFVWTYKFKGHLCAGTVNVLDSPFGPMNLGKFCIEASYKVDRLPGQKLKAGIDSCKAEAFGVKCSSCKPCTTAGRGTPGIELNCNNLQTRPCLALRLPLGNQSPVVHSEDLFQGVDIKSFAIQQAQAEADKNTEKDEGDSDEEKDSGDSDEEDNDDSDDEEDKDKKKAKDKKDAEKENINKDKKKVKDKNDRDKEKEKKKKEKNKKKRKRFFGLFG